MAVFNHLVLFILEVLLTFFIYVNNSQKYTFDIYNKSKALLNTCENDFHTDHKYSIMHGGLLAASETK